MRRVEPSSGYFSWIVIRNGVRGRTRHGKNARARQGWREAEPELPAAVLPRGNPHLAPLEQAHPGV